MYTICHLGTKCACVNLMPLFQENLSAPSCSNRTHCVCNTCFLRPFLLTLVTVPGILQELHFQRVRKSFCIMSNFAVYSCMEHYVLPFYYHTFFCSHNHLYYLLVFHIMAVWCLMKSTIIKDIAFLTYWSKFALTCLHSALLFLDLEVTWLTIFM